MANKLRYFWLSLKLVILEGQIAYYEERLRRCP